MKIVILYILVATYQPVGALMGDPWRIQSYAAEVPSLEVCERAAERFQENPSVIAVSCVTQQEVSYE